MSLELCDDRVIFDLYDAETKEIVQGYEFDDERVMGLENRSHIAQLKAAISALVPRLRVCVSERGYDGGWFCLSDL